MKASFVDSEKYSHLVAIRLEAESRRESSLLATFVIQGYDSVVDLGDSYESEDGSWHVGWVIIKPVDNTDAD